ncbi:MAG TPA: PilZ domain-containing protein [Leptospiraceae bacterium]|nr:PilZ domain-containing protein [Leptospiraceae bacterium]HMW05747.1 PilZ domain-containing protein [Leptospiraceae bacterium]HMX32486.1 PilZ domain-containing protein [Leptospiraceae bacterium]HMY30220.1 PilZ domain-containing protein [Leptospiraceae bacterium]HMZ67171.1 PilZ domain-containing protein [Leptospiraceae bacterium]
MAEAKQLFNKSFSVFDPKKQKRKKARVRLSTPGNYYLHSQKNRSMSCHLIDLGTGGLTIQAPSPLYIGDRLTVEFILDGKTLRISGTVARATGKDYVIRYEELPPFETGIIQEYIHKVFFRDENKDKSK